MLPTTACITIVYAEGNATLAGLFDASSRGLFRVKWCEAQHRNVFKKSIDKGASAFTRTRSIYSDHSNSVVRRQVTSSSEVFSASNRLVRYVYRKAICYSAGYKS